MYTLTNTLYVIAKAVKVCEAQVFLDQNSLEHKYTQVSEVHTHTHTQGEVYCVQEQKHLNLLLH